MKMPTGKRSLPWTDMYTKIDVNKKSLREFGSTMCLCFFIIGSILFLRHKQGYVIFWSAAFAFLFFAQISPVILTPIYKFWMGFAFCLGWLNTQLILIIVYYIVLTPTGLLVKLFKKDFLNLKIEEGAKSYWIRKDHSVENTERYEKIF